MYHTAIASRGQVLKRNQNTARWQGLRSGLGPVSNMIFVILMVAIVGLLYLTQLTRSTNYSYSVDELEQTKAKLLAENEQLENEAARLQALERVQNSSVAKGLENSTDTRFVD